MNCRWLMCLAGCLAAARICADDWVLTGLAREHGRVRAYLSSSGEAFLTLQPGEDRWGWRLVGVSFRARCVWLADATRTVRVTSATSPTVSNSMAALAPSPGQAVHRSDSTTGDMSGTPMSELNGFAVASLNESVTDPPTWEFAPVVISTAAPASPVTEPVSGRGEKGGTPRRAATADELFKARNGYGAWEALLRRRHEAAALGLPIPER